MKYQTFQPQADLKSLIKCYWTLEISAEKNYQKQRIVPDGCIEMAFILGDDIKRYNFENEYILQPRAMVLGQTIEPFYIEPTGNVNSFAIRFYPYGFANFVTTPINNLANKETPIALLFGEKRGKELEQKIVQANNTKERIEISEHFLLEIFKNKETINSIVKSTVDTILATKGKTQINAMLNENQSKRRQLERNFVKEVGISPKQLSRIIRLQTALKLLLNQQSVSLTHIAYESEYYDQAHFIRDFKEFTGINPKDFLLDDKTLLSSLFYSNL